jgi:N-acylneuraminate cytidylyltransferase
MKTIAIIPARSGSKRIPNKNIKLFFGKPIIAYSINTACASGLFERVIVSTDSPEIARISTMYGAEVPFLRPKELSDDHTPIRPVVNHAINMIAAANEPPEFICCLYATAPFLQPEDLKAAFKILNKTQCDFVISVTRFSSPIQRALKLNDNGRVEMFCPEYFQKRSQDLECAYHDAGQFNFGRTKAFLNDVPTFSNASVPFIIPRYRSEDIDSLEDWYRAEILFEILQRNPLDGE